MVAFGHVHAHQGRAYAKRNNSGVVRAFTIHIVFVFYCCFFRFFA